MVFNKVVRKLITERKSVWKITSFEILKEEIKKNPLTQNRVIRTINDRITEIKFESWEKNSGNAMPCYKYNEIDDTFDQNGKFILVVYKALIPGDIKKEALEKRLIFIFFHELAHINYLANFGEGIEKLLTEEVERFINENFDFARRIYYGAHARGYYYDVALETFIAL